MTSQNDGRAAVVDIPAVLGFRPTPELRQRITSARPLCAEAMNIPTRSVTSQLVLCWLLDTALKSLEK